MNDDSVWAPSWKWTVGISVGLIIFTFAIASTGINPFQTLAAGVIGAIGGALGALTGALIGHFTSKSEGSKNQLLQILAGLGLIVGFLAEKLVSGGVTALIDPSGAATEPGGLVPGILFGGIAGALLGLIPQLALQNKARSFGNMSFWVCFTVGLIGGAVLALPTAIILFLVGRRRSDSRAT